MADLSNEIRRFPPSRPGSDPIHLGIMYPNTYPVAIASLGFQTIHLIAHSHPGIVTHRIVLDKEDGKLYPSRTLEEGLGIKSLTALLISCSFELDYIHLVRMLDEAGIPVLRTNRRSLPLVIIGGVAPTANPEPLALIADAIAIGDGEIILPDLIDDLQEIYPLLQGARFIKGRDQLYELWNQRDGVYVPAHWENDSGEFINRSNHRINQAAMDDPNVYPSYTPIISPDGVYGAKNLVMISGGCPSRCRFCLLSHIYPSGPDRTLDGILENARLFSPEEASVGLVSSRVSDHPDIVEVIDTLASDGYIVSVSSLKVAGTDREMLNSLAGAGARSVTFAPEHGSDRIRELIHKAYTYEQVRDRVNWAFDAGMSRVKLYFLIGFQEETEDDLDATPEFILSLVKDTGLATRPVGNRMIIGLAAFVPKAGTPFQHRAMEDERTLKRKMRRITNALKNQPRIDIDIESPRSSIIQGMLSIADRSVGRHLDAISRTRGSLLSSWDEVLNKLGDDPKVRLITDRGVGSSPWNFIKRPKQGIEK